MPLDESQKQTLQDWMKSKHVSANCAACGRNQWAPGDVISAPVMTGQGVAFGGPSVPMVQLICANCAHTMLFAAVPIGLV